ncbi:MAG: hypothetical protein ACREVV_02655 [Steroidobacteraceae bacterium]
MKQANLAVVTCALACMPLVLSQEQHSHPAPERLGTVTFPTSCVPGVQSRFERGVALLHSFAYAAAEEAFRAVARADPHCAMAHWGMSMSYFHQLWEPPGAEELRKGSMEIGSAQRLQAGEVRLPGLSKRRSSSAMRRLRRHCARN